MAKCEDLIDEKLESRIENFEKVLEGEEEFNILDSTKYELYRVDISYGGPSDYFEFLYDPENGELVEVRYHYLDWGDGAERIITGGSDFEILEDIFLNYIKTY